MATQNYIYDTKRFCYQNKPPVPPLVQPLPPHNPLPAPTIEIIHSIIYYCTVFDRIKNDFGWSLHFNVAALQALAGKTC